MVGRPFQVLHCLYKQLDALVRTLACAERCSPLLYAVGTGTITSVLEKGARATVRRAFSDPEFLGRLQLKARVGLHLSVANSRLCAAAACHYVCILALCSILILCLGFISS